MAEIAATLGLALVVRSLLRAPHGTCAADIGWRRQEISSMERYKLNSLRVQGRFGLAFAATVAATLFIAYPAAGETLACPLEASLCGITFNDVNGDKIQQAGEYNIGGPEVLVVAINTDTKAVSTSETSCDPVYPESCGYYTMSLDPGTYDVCIVDPSAPKTCEGHTETQPVEIESGSPVPQDLGKPPADIVISGPGTGTPGYWKNHAWPVATLVVGGVEMTRESIIKLMGKVAGDKTYTIFASYVSARLNVIAGNNDSCVSEAITNAEAWLTDFPVGSKVLGSDYVWSGEEQGESYHQTMDRYNNGLLPCAVHRN